jgi:fructose-bisphosphate aldolase class I
MNQSMFDIASSLLVAGEGLLAIDESDATCDLRFARLGIPQTMSALCDYRELSVAATHGAYRIAMKLT